MSETDFLKLKKHDNVETNTEKFDIENYLNGNWDKINKNAKEVNTEISNINSNNTELEKELKEAQEDFYQASVRGQASGEYIHVEDSSNCRARIGIGGNSEQETRNGKNILELMEGTYSNNGITAVVKDGVITLNGTATAISFVGINLLKNFNLITENAYRLSAFNTEVVGNSSDNLCSLRLNGEGTKETTLNKTNSNKAITGNFLLTYITIRTAQGITYNNFVVKPQLELGAGTNEWEQGGVSPSPDYQSPVKTVGSNANLIEETFEGYNINANGAFEKANGYDMQIAKLKANIKYTLNADTYVFGYYNEKPTIASITYDKSRVVLPQSLNTIIPTRDGYISFRTDKTDNNKKIKLVEGTEVGEYSKYGQGCVKVTKCNKNLFGKYVTGIWLDTSKKLYLASSTAVGFIARVKPNTTYTIKKKNKGNRFLLTAGKEPVKIDNAFSRLIFASNHDLTQYTFTTKENEYYIFLGVYSGTDENELALAVEETQLECGNKATTCEEHKEQSYIMPVQQEMLEGDYFDFDNEEEVHIFGKKVLTGNENWEAIGTNTSGKYRFQTKVDDIAFNADGDTYLEGICDSYKVGTPNTTYLCQESIATVQYYLIIYNEKVNDTVENFKKGLSNKNVTIYYKLATPTRLKFTDKQKAVAKELNNARTYKNVTNITTDSIAILDLDYAKDLETLLTSKESEV